MINWLRIVIGSLPLLFAGSWLSMSLNPLPMVEICDNAIDDDGDGDIDLNDEDCACTVAEPQSLIPNASFEDNDCCPPTRSSLHCAQTWIQASAATTDYLHSCGWMGWEDLPPPLPFPDGEACIGFRNGRFGQSPNPNWKEYTGACLSRPLRAGNSYRFQFHIGFTHPANSPPISVVFYGSTSCEYLPFGVDDDAFGCPTNGPGWKVLSTTYATGANSWTIREFNVTPTQDIYAIAIGPNCQPAFTEDNPYYFLDNLILADVREFEFVISGSGHPCASDFTLNLPKRDSLSYQWYRDGIAIPGAIDTSYQPVEEGVYQVRIIGPESCRVTKQYLHSLPKPSYETTKYLCEDEHFDFNGQMLTQSGIYFDTLKTADQCDSIIRLELTKVRDTTIDLQAKFFAGEQFTVGHEVFEEPTNTQVVLTSKYGCDSIIRLDLSHYQVYIPNAFSPNGDGINDRFTVQGGEDLIGITSLRIFGRWGELCYEVENVNKEDLNTGWDGTTNGQPREGIHTYIMVLRMNDGLDHILHGSVLILR